MDIDNVTNVPLKQWSLAIEFHVPKLKLNTTTISETINKIGKLRKNYENEFKLDHI